jgi:hypothetical protein
MFIQIEDPSDLPRPPEEVQIRTLEIEPYPDGRRLRVHMELTPFLEPPDLTLRVQDQRGEAVADLSIISAQQSTMSLTVHLRGPEPKGSYTMEAVILYDDLGQVNRIERVIDLTMEKPDDPA